LLLLEEVGGNRESKTEEGDKEVGKERRQERGDKERAEADFEV
jgi:hypothetical protein